MADKAATSSRIAELTRRLERDPGSRIFLELAREHHSAGNPAEAVRVCREGLKKNPTYISARVLLSRVLIDQKLFAEARPELEAVVRQSPDNLLARRLLGEALTGAGETGAALEVVRDLLRLSPRDREALEMIRTLEGAAPPGAPPTEPPPGVPAGVQTLKVPMPHEVAQAVEAEEAVEPVAAGAPASLQAEPPPHAAEAMQPVQEAAPPVEGATQPAPSAAEISPAEPVAEAPVSAVPGAYSFAAEDLEALPREAAERLRTEAQIPEVPGAPPTPETAPQVPAAPEVSWTPEAPLETCAASAPEVLVPPEAAAAPAPVPEPATTGWGVPPAAGEAAGLEEAQKPGAGVIATPTLAEIYVAQGLTEKALEVYREVLVGDPHNEEVRSRIADLTRRLSPAGDDARRKVAALRGWLERIRRAHHVQDHAGRDGPETAGM